MTLHIHGKKDLSGFAVVFVEQGADVVCHLCSCRSHRQRPVEMMFCIYLILFWCHMAFSQ